MICGFGLLHCYWAVNETDFRFGDMVCELELLFHQM